MLPPAVATLLTSEVAWGWDDFAIAVSLLAAAWLTLEASTRLVPDGVVWKAAAIAIGIAFLAVWALLAVGL